MAGQFEFSRQAAQVELIVTWRDMTKLTNPKRTPGLAGLKAHRVPLHAHARSQALPHTPSHVLMLNVT